MATIKEIKDLLDNTKDCTIHSANTLEMVCNMKSVNGLLSEVVKEIRNIADKITDIDEYKITRVVCAINQAQRLLDSTLKIYLYPRQDGPRCQEIAFDDGYTGIAYINKHAYYTDSAVRRILKKFHAKWRLPKPSDIVDVPSRDMFLGTWALMKNGVLGILMEFEGKVQVAPVNQDVKLRVILINKNLPA